MKLYKRLLSLRARIIVPLFVILVLSVVATLITTSVSLKSFNSGKVEESLSRYSASLSAQIEEEQNRMAYGALSLTRYPDIVAAIAATSSGEEPNWDFIADFLSSLRASFLIVTNAEGTVLINTLDTETIGKNMADHAEIAAAIEGRAVSSFGSDSIAKLYVASGMPLYNSDNELAGVASVGIRFDTRTFVQKLKQRTDADVAVIVGNVSVATTFADIDGQFGVGTEVDPSVISLLETENDAATGNIAAFGSSYNIAFKQVKDLNGKNLGAILTAYDDALDAKDVRKFEMTNAFVSAGSLFVAVVLMFFVTTSIIRPITGSKPLLEKAAKGDFTVRLPSDVGGEFGQLFDSFNMVLIHNRTTLQSLIDSYGQLRSASHEFLDFSSSIRANTYNLISQTTEVGANVEEISAEMSNSASHLSTVSDHIQSIVKSIDSVDLSIDSLARVTKDTSMGSQKTFMLMESIKSSIDSASNAAHNGSAVVLSVAESVGDMSSAVAEINHNCVNATAKMDEATSAVTKANDIVTSLEDSSLQISKIVDVISDITDQTNILALNAAIEAAGVGEAGKGFMIVASEVKDLARQTATANDEIGLTIHKMQDSMMEAVNTFTSITTVLAELNEFVKGLAYEISVQNSQSIGITDSSNRAAKLIGDISSEINRISENSAQVATSSENSSKESEQVAKLTDKLVSNSREIATNSERAAADLSEINMTTRDIDAGLYEISKNIEMIANVSQTVEKGVDKAFMSAKELDDIATTLEGLINRFKIE